MTERAFWRRFGRLEHEQLEFKTSVYHLHESVVAMAMGAGGVLIAGVTDDRRIVGCAHDQQALDRIAFVVHETQVDIVVRPLVVSGTPVIAIEIPAVPGRIVTTPDGRILRRLGSSNQPLRGDAVARFVRARLDPTT